jgi:hypothetical protein
MRWWVVVTVTACRRRSATRTGTTARTTAVAIVTATAAGRSTARSAATTVSTAHRPRWFRRRSSANRRATARALRRCCCGFLVKVPKSVNAVVATCKKVIVVVKVYHCVSVYVRAIWRRVQLDNRRTKGVLDLRVCVEIVLGRMEKALYHPFKPQSLTCGHTSVKRPKKP